MPGISAGWYGAVCWPTRLLPWLRTLNIPKMKAGLRVAPEGSDQKEAIRFIYNDRSAVHCRQPVTPPRRDFKQPPAAVVEEVQVVIAEGSSLPEAGGSSKGPEAGQDAVKQLHDKVCVYSCLTHIGVTFQNCTCDTRKHTLVLPGTRTS